jgi:hypothetical protein
MTELHTVVARYQGVAARTREELTEVYRKVGHAPLFMGSIREMRSINEEVPDEKPEISLPSLTAQTLFQRIQNILTESWDLMATRDRSNMDAAADIVVDGETLAERVPVSTLLSLHKQFTDLRTELKAMPVRDPSKVWTFDRDLSVYRAPEVSKARTRKEIKAAELSPATERHPAQVTPFNLDVVVGHYVTTEFSGAPSTQERQDLVDRVNKLIDAVKTARTEANQAAVTDVRIGSKLLGYVFAR